MKNDKERLRQLENVLAQMLQPVRGIPLSVIIKSIAGHAVIPIDRGAAEDRLLIDTLCEAAKLAGAALRKLPIIRPRPNEVGMTLKPTFWRPSKSWDWNADGPRPQAGL